MGCSLQFGGSKNADRLHLFTDKQAVPNVFGIRSFREEMDQHAGLQYGRLHGRIDT